MPQSPQELEQFSCLHFPYPTSRQVRPWLFHPRHLRAAKVQVFVDFLAQIFGQGFNEN
ncbi:hypothetical protein ACQ4WP_20660 [Janthinobacterium sp. GB4P2]|uniref:hypothetical protein n=1 Tax=Janthinobacterium sp. GB4P2 TaxID=3424189 RepID=UPI003F22A036